tara:strand:- start:554 stop:1039 length:486 start_codon:yes stop_codon:yes gene_type:complete
MKKFLFYIVFIFASLVFAQDKNTFKDHDEIIRSFKGYIRQVDKKNINGMFRYFHDTITLHSGTDKPIVLTSKEEFDKLFISWKASPNANFVSTRLDTIHVAPVWDVADTKLCVADATYSRLNEKGKVIGRGRALYHFVKWDKSFLKWKIYMISDLDVESVN